MRKRNSPESRGTNPAGQRKINTMEYFTSAELCQAAAALAIIEEKGDEDEFRYILKQRTEAAQGNGRWVPGSIRYNLGCDAFADELARLLGESKERCLRAVEAVFGGDKRRAVFDAIVDYASELTGEPTQPGPTYSPEPSNRGVPTFPAIQFVLASEVPT